MSAGASRRGSKRLLLVEFFPAALRRNEKSMLFPFLKGLAEDSGVEALWLCFGGDSAAAADESSGRTMIACLPPRDLRALSAHLNRFRPTHVITSDVLCPEAKALLSARRPAPETLVMATLPDAVRGVKPGSAVARLAGMTSGDPRRRDYFGRCSWFLDWLGVSGPGSPQGFLIASARPDYGAVMANRSARESPAHVTIVSGGLCGNRRTLKDNADFKGVDLEGIWTHYGCSFCNSAAIPSLSPPGADAAELVERQLRAVAEAGGGRGAGVFEFYDFRAFWKIDEVLGAALRLKMPPSVFLFNPRIDDVLRVRRRLEKVLPGLARAGHQVRILSMGIENFSERENSRFNKDISLAQVDELLGLARKWEKEFPGVFRPFKAGHEKVELGFIFFTPWTTLDDVRINLTRAKERGFSECGYWLYSTLHIRDVEPIHRLALKEGDVLVERWPDRGLAYGLAKNEGEAGALVPWRFKDPKAADFFALLVRVCAADRDGADCAYFEGDADFASAARLYLRARDASGVTPLSFALDLLARMQASSRPESREALLRGALPERAAPMPAAPEPAKPRPAPAPSRAARDAEAALERMRHERLDAGSGLTLESVADVEGAAPARLRLAFSREGRRIVVDLCDARSPGPGFLRSRRFRAVYHSDAPVTTDAQTRFLAALLRLLDESEAPEAGEAR